MTAWIAYPLAVFTATCSLVSVVTSVMIWGRHRHHRDFWACMILGFATYVPGTVVTVIICLIAK